MPTLRSALLCAYTAVILVSCNTKKSIKMVAGKPVLIEKQIFVKTSPEVLNLADFHNKFIDASTQHFTVSSKRVTIIKCKAGLKITITPASLEKESGEAINKNIEISVIELTKVTDLYKSNAATVSNGKLLVSGGSYFIGMESDGEKLKMKSGKSMQVEFPVLRSGDMELFYGERNIANDMNWEKLNTALAVKNEKIEFTNNLPDVAVNLPLGEIREPKIYKSLNEEVYYYRKKMTLETLVDTLNKNKPIVFLQKISFWPKNLPVNTKLDSNFLVRLYGPRHQYILRTCKDAEREKIDNEKRVAAQKTFLANFQPRSLAGRIQKYYAPSAVTMLGWINCDRFYQFPKEAETNLELPYAFNKCQIEYFVLFKSFNGLLKNSIFPTADGRVALSNLPLGEDITVIAFLKKDGIIYQAKEDFVVGSNKIIPVNFKEISLNEMNEIFGDNVKI